MNTEQPSPAPGVSSLDPAARAAVFQALRPTLEALVHEAAADPRLSAEARRVFRAVARTRAENTLALADLAARSSTPKTRVPAVLNQLEGHGYLARLACIAPHLVAALPTPTIPAPENLRSTAGDHHEGPEKQTPPDHDTNPAHRRTPISIRAR